MSEPVLLDVTALVAMPARSGIQRVEREAIRHWPGQSSGQSSDQSSDHGRLLPVVLDPDGGIRVLPDAARAVLAPPPDREAPSFAQDQAALARLLAAAPALPRRRVRHILNLELFYDDWRAAAYRRLCRDGVRVQWLVYDFMPWLHPGLFPPDTARACMHYLRALRAVPEVAFISRQTAEEYAGRVMRKAGPPAGPHGHGPVLPLGADGLGLERQHWSPSRRDIVMIGTLERRKNIHPAMDAFRLLWADGVDVRLVLAGRIDPALRPALDAFAAEAGPRLVLLDHAGDGELRAALRRARAVLSASAVEGFGLPPYEALHSGIPAIAAASLPSLQGLKLGHIALPEITAATLAAAVASVMDDTVAARLWAEAAELRLPGWRDFAAAVAAWTR